MSSSPAAFPAATQPEMVLQIGHDAPVKGVAYSPDGRWLATYNELEPIRLWDARTGELQRTLSTFVKVSADAAWASQRAFSLRQR